MTKEEAIALLTGGEDDIKEWNRLWCKRGGSIPELSHADLRDANLIEANLTHANLKNTKLANAKLTGAYMECATLRDARLNGATLTGAKLTGADLRNADLRNSNLQNAKLNTATLDGAMMDSALCDSAHLRKTSLTKATFTGASLIKVDLTGAKASRANFSNAKLHLAKLTNAELIDANLKGAKMKGAQLGGANLSGATLNDADLHDAVLGGAKLSSADLTGANLRNAKLPRADLTKANLKAVEVDSGTDFEGATVDECVVYKHTLEALKNHGGLAPGDRMRMKIEDGLARLQMSFSGFLAWVHACALAVFLFPYVWFVLAHWYVGKLQWDVTETISLWGALWRFIFSGGERWYGEWQVNWFPFTLFFFAFAYNCLRGVLLYKTKTLELKKEASGLPSTFTLTGLWGILYRSASIGFVMNLLVVLVHTVLFLLQEIPMPQADLSTVPLDPGA